MASNTIIGQDNPIIEALDITKVYKVGDYEIQALRGVSLKIFPGDFISIVGKSGSGKSTLMHILGLLDSPTSGKIYLKGNDVSEMSENKMAKLRNMEIGFVFQTFNLLARATVLENILLPLHYSSLAKSVWSDKAKNILEDLQMSDRIHNKSNELSGGQKQRVAIGRALINDPAIIFADEPTGNLDSKTGEEIERIFTNLNKKGVTIVIVTHDSDLASITKKRYVIHDGKIVP